MFVYIICVIIFIIVWKWKFSYWSRAGLESYETSFLEGIGPTIYNAYYHFKRNGVKHGGTFLLFRSVYVPADLDLMRNILQTDFEHFVNHGLIKDPPPLLRHLANMDNEEWRIWRARLTPTFTSGKIKMMFHTVLEKASILENKFREQAAINEAIDIKDIFSRYTIDVIGSTIFGIECNSLQNPNAEFRKFGKRLLDRIQFVVLFSQLPPSVLKFFGLRYIPKELESFFLTVVKNTIRYRESNNIYRKDFMHLLLQLKNKGKVVGDEDETVLGDKSTTGDHLSLIQIAAQCLEFFAAGYETSATTITFALLELAQNEEIQNRLRSHIRDVLKEHGGKMTYEAVMKMDYLDKVVQETLRKYPPAQLFPRICNKDYLVPGTNFVIKKGQQIILPFRAIHHDPEYWPEPEKFDPERFSAENKARRHRFAYLPFGEGPRMCIGARFGSLQSKIGIISVIKDFKLSLSPRTQRPIEVDYHSFIIAVKGILWMNVEQVVLC